MITYSEKILKRVMRYNPTVAQLMDVLKTIDILLWSSSIPWWERYCLSVQGLHASNPEMKAKSQSRRWNLIIKRLQPKLKFQIPEISVLRKVCLSFGSLSHEFEDQLSNTFLYLLSPHLFFLIHSVFLLLLFFSKIDMLKSLLQAVLSIRLR